MNNKILLNTNLDHYDQGVWEIFNVLKKAREQFIYNLITHIHV